MITPFTADGRVDYEALGRMIDYVIEGGADYIVALGTTAETPTLYIQERAVVAMFIANQIRHRVPLVIGVGGNSTSEVLDQLREFDLRGRLRARGRRSMRRPWFGRRCRAGREPLRWVVPVADAGSRSARCGYWPDRLP